jgi:hypothetical protein
MTQCIRRNCKNDAVGGNSYRKSLCIPCKKDISNGEQLYVSCTICKKSIFIQQMAGGPRFTCSERCAKKRVAKRNKESYDSKRPKDIFCIRCEKPIKRQGKKASNARKKFCSKVCYDRNEYYRNHFKRHFTKMLRLQHIIIRGLTIKK